MPMYSLIEYSDNYSKTSGSLWQYYRDEPALTDDGAVDNLPGNSTLFKFQCLKLSVTVYDIKLITAYLNEKDVYAGFTFY